MIWELVEKLNEGRDPERLALKYKKMAVDALAFFRGTAHLFYEDWPKDKTLNDVPAAWLCGDLHLENFGTYRADNRLTYFDCNDFDEGCLGPAVWDIARLLVSVAIECNEREYRAKETRDLCGRVAVSYANEMRRGKPRWTERETSAGIIRDLFDGLQLRTAGKYLNSRTVMEKRRRRINTDNGRALPASAKDKAAVMSFIDRRTEFACIDVARRVAGNGSLGVPRFVVLAEDEDRNPFLLDMKLAQMASPLRYHKTAQPYWANDAERIVGAATLVLAMPPAFLRAVVFAGHGWVLRELLPSEDRVDVASSADSAFRSYAEALGAIAAWGQLRASGRKGSATGDDLAAWDVPCRRLVEFAQDYGRRVDRDWLEFRKAWERKTKK
ncbi:MAG: DUF2252 family protein [Acidobacteria bacterium]|nr:DUF2252 family protein [Acidobacteriota bacterium]